MAFLVCVDSFFSFILEQFSNTGKQHDTSFEASLNQNFITCRHQFLPEGNSCNLFVAAFLCVIYKKQVPHFYQKHNIGILYVKCLTPDSSRRFHWFAFPSLSCSCLQIDRKIDRKFYSQMGQGFVLQLKSLVLLHHQKLVMVF